MGSDSVQNLAKGISLDDIISSASNYKGNNTVNLPGADEWTYYSDDSTSYDTLSSLLGESSEVSLIARDPYGGVMGEVYDGDLKKGTFRVKDGSIHSVMWSDEGTPRESYEWPDDIKMPKSDPVPHRKPGLLEESGPTPKGLLVASQGGLMGFDAFVPGSHNRRRFETEPVYVDDYGVTDKLGAFYSQTLIGKGVQSVAESAEGVFDWATGQDGPDIDFNDHLTDEEKQHAYKFGGVKTMGDLMRRRESLASDDSYNEILSRASAGEILTYGLFTQATDPVNWFSFGLGFAAKGATFAAKAAHAGSVATVQTAVQEAGLQALHRDRTLEESASNVAFSFAFSTGLAGSLHAWRAARKDFRDVTDGLDKENPFAKGMTNREVIDKEFEKPEVKPVSSAEASFEPVGLGSKRAEFLIKPFNDKSKAAFSQARSVRKLAHSLVNIPVDLVTPTLRDVPVEVTMKTQMLDVDNLSLVRSKNLLNGLSKDTLNSIPENIAGKNLPVEDRLFTLIDDVAQDPELMNPSSEKFIFKDVDLPKEDLEAIRSYAKEAEDFFKGYFTELKAKSILGTEAGKNALASGRNYTGRTFDSSAIFKDRAGFEMEFTDIAMRKHDAWLNTVNNVFQNPTEQFNVTRDTFVHPWAFHDASDGASSLTDILWDTYNSIKGTFDATGKTDEEIAEAKKEAKTVAKPTGLSKETMDELGALDKEAEAAKKEVVLFIKRSNASLRKIPEIDKLFKGRVNKAISKEVSTAVKRLKDTKVPAGYKERAKHLNTLFNAAVGNPVKARYTKESFEPDSADATKSELSAKNYDIFMKISESQKSSIPKGQTEKGLFGRYFGSRKKLLDFTEKNVVAKEASDTAREAAEEASKKAVGKAKSKVDKALAKYSPDITKAKKLAEDISNRLTDGGGRTSMFDFIDTNAAKGKEFFLSRTLNFLEPDDLKRFQVTDIRVKMRSYGGKAIRALNLFDYQDLAGSKSSWQTEINSEYAELKKGKSESEQLSLERDRKRDIAAIERMIQELSGKRDAEVDFSDAVFKTGTNLAVSAQLGTAVISATADLATPIMTHGFFNTMSSHVKQLKSIASKGKSSELQDAVVLSEEFTQQGLRELNSVGGRVDTDGAIVRYTSALPHLLFKYTGMYKVTQYARMSAARASNTRITEIGALLRAGKGISDDDVSFLASRGLTEDDAILVSRLMQVSTGSSKYKDGVGGWSSLETKLKGSRDVDKRMYVHVDDDGREVPTDIFFDEVQDIRTRLNRAAVIGATSDVLSAGPGTVPKLLSGHSGMRFIGTYLPFLFAATQRVAVPIIQNPLSARKMATVTTMIAISMMGTYLKSSLRGDSGKYDKDPDQLLRDGLFNSGVLGVPGLLFELGLEATSGRHDAPQRTAVKAAGAGVGYGIGVVKAGVDPSWENTLRVLPFNNFLGINALWGR